MKKPVPKHVVVSEEHHAELRRIAIEREEKLRKTTHRMIRFGLAIEALNETQDEKE